MKDRIINKILEIVKRNSFTLSFFRIKSTISSIVKAQNKNQEIIDLIYLKRFYGYII